MLSSIAETRQTARAFGLCFVEYIMQAPVASTSSRCTSWTQLPRCFALRHRVPSVRPTSRCACCYRQPLTAIIHLRLLDYISNTQAKLPATVRDRYAHYFLLLAMLQSPTVDTLLLALHPRANVVMALPCRHLQACCRTGSRLGTGSPQRSGSGTFERPELHTAASATTSNTVRRILLLSRWTLQQQAQHCSDDVRRQRPLLAAAAARTR